MKFFTKYEQGKISFIKVVFYDNALKNKILSYSSIIQHSRVTTYRKKFDTLYEESLFKNKLFWQSLSQIKAVKKVKFFKEKQILSQRRLKNLTISERFLNLFFKDGLKSKYQNYLNKSIQQLYHTLYFF